MNNKYTREELINELYKFIEENGKIPTSRNMTRRNGYPSYYAYIKEFGSLKYALNIININDETHVYTEQELIEAFYKFININGRIPRLRDMTRKNGYIPERIFKNMFGSWNNFLVKVRCDKVYTKQELIDEIYRFIIDNGKVPSSHDMRKYNGYIPYNNFVNVFGTWGNALIAANVEHNKDYCKYVKEELINELHRFVEEHDKIPTCKDISEVEGYPSSVSYNNHFGTFNNALIIAGYKVNKLWHKNTENDKCEICHTNKTGCWHYKDNIMICDKCYNGDRNYFHGKLNPYSNTGIGVITEHIVYEVLGDCIKCNTTDDFNSSYDLISEKYGTINVKSSKFKRTNKYNRGFWTFGKHENAKIPNYYICLGFDENKTKIEHTWIIPGIANIVKNSGINISKHNLDRVNQYEVDIVLYNIVYKNLKVDMLPEFCNLSMNEKVLVND